MNRRAHTPVAPGSVPLAPSLALRSRPSWLLRALPALPFTPSLPVPSSRAARTPRPAQDYDAAFDFFQKANAKDPKDLSYRTALYRVRQTASSMQSARGANSSSPATNQAHLPSFCMPPKSTPATKPLSRKSHEFARKMARSHRVRGRLPEPLASSRKLNPSAPRST